MDKVKAIMARGWNTGCKWPQIHSFSVSTTIIPLMPKSIIVHSLLMTIFISRLQYHEFEHGV